MNELYWITVLGNVGAACLVIAGIAICITCFFVIAYHANNDLDTQKKIKRTLFISGTTGIIFTIFTCLIPSKKELYFIYGAGTVMDYCQNNPKVKELPDKVVIALNTWLDIVNKENEKNEP